MRTIPGTILLLLAFNAGIAIANGTANETPVINVTGIQTATLTAIPTATIAPEADDSETEDESMIGPGNALYGLKIAFENIEKK